MQRHNNKESVQQLTKQQFSVLSRTEKGVTYHVDMEIASVDRHPDRIEILKAHPLFPHFL